MGKDWYKSKRRRTLLDMHIEDWDPVFLSKFDPKDYFDALIEANINAPMIYLQSHVGLCYWPTKSGKMHGSFKGREDTMNRLFDMCHNAGMDVITYYSVVYNNWAYDNYPDWRLINIHGNASRTNGGRYGLCCPNNQGYQSFVAKQIEEMCECFTFEGIFIDMTFWPFICFCPACKERWQKETGAEIPVVIDWKDPEWLKFQETRGRWLEEFAQFITREVKKHKPDCSVEHQCAGLLRYWGRTVKENIVFSNDYVGSDMYGGIEEQSFACKAFYDLTQNQPFEYMTSRCYPNLREHTSTKTLDQLRTCVMLTQLHHGASLLIDAIDPIGTIDHSVYKKFGTVYREAEKYEPWLSRGRMLYDVALFLNLDGKMDVEKNKVSLAVSEAADPSMPHLDALKGAAFSLRRRHIPYGVISGSRPELLKEIKMLVLPDVPNMPKEYTRAVRDFVEKGGKLYMSGHSAPELLKEFFNLQWQGLTEETVTYISPRGDYEPLNSQCTSEHPLVMFERAVKVIGKGNGVILGTITLPFTLPFAHSAVSFPNTSVKEIPSAPQYRFASIHSDPPGRITDMPALVYTKYGDGEVIWSALPIEKANRPQHSSLFSSLVTGLVGPKNMQFGAKASDSIECILFEDIDTKQKILGIINLQESFHVMPAVDTTVYLSSAQAPKAVFGIPGEEPIPYQYTDGKITISFDRIDYFKVIGLQY